MRSKTPLELAGRMVRKSHSLFLRLRHPGFAIFPELGVEAIEDARALAAKAEQDDRDAAAIIADVLADGVVTPEEIPLLQRAQRKVLRSAGLDNQLASGGAA